MVVPDAAAWWWLASANSVNTGAFWLRSSSSAASVMIGQGLRLNKFLHIDATTITASVLATAYSFNANAIGLAAAWWWLASSNSVNTAAASVMIGQGLRLNKFLRMTSNNNWLCSKGQKQPDILRIVIFWPFCWWVLKTLLSFFHPKKQARKHSRRFDSVRVFFLPQPNNRSKSQTESLIRCCLRRNRNHLRSSLCCSSPYLWRNYDRSCRGNNLPVATTYPFDTNNNLPVRHQPQPTLSTPRVATPTQQVLIVQLPPHEKRRQPSPFATAQSFVSQRNRLLRKCKLLFWWPFR